MELGTRKWGFLTSGTYSNFGDLRMGSVRHPAYPDFGKINHHAVRIDGVDTMLTNPDPNVHIGSGYNQLDLLEKIIYRPSDNAQYSLNLQYSQSSNIPRYDNLNDYSGDNLRWSEWYYGPQVRMLGAFNAHFKRDRGIFTEASITAAFQRQEESRHTRRFGNSNRTSRWEAVNAYTLNADLSKDLSERTKLNYGLEAVYNDVSSRAEVLNIDENITSNTFTRYPDGGSDVQQGGLYANVRHGFGKSEKVTASLGVRMNVTRMELRFDDTTLVQLPFNNISVGVVYRPDDKTMLRATASTGFRAPNVDDNGKVFERSGLVTVPNNELKPEYTYNGEIAAVRSLFDDVVTVEATGFYTYMQDAIVRQTTSSTALIPFYTMASWAAWSPTSTPTKRRFTASAFGWM